VPTDHRGTRGVGPGIAHGEPDKPGDRALRGVEHDDQQPPALAEYPRHVEPARVAGPFPTQVDPAPRRELRDDVRVRDGADQVADHETDDHLDEVGHGHESTAPGDWPA
jgi:hypothetical protein